MPLPWSLLFDLCLDSHHPLHWLKFKHSTISAKIDFKQIPEERPTTISINRDVRIHLLKDVHSFCTQQIMDGVPSPPIIKVGFLVSVVLASNVRSAEVT